MPTIRDRHEVIFRGVGRKVHLFPDIFIAVRRSLSIEVRPQERLIFSGCLARSRESIEVG